jgi:hypothetical protein
MAIHNDIGTSSRLSEEVLNTIANSGGDIPIPEDTIPINSTPISKYFDGGIGMTLYGNTYRKRMTPNERERGTILENTSP